MFEFTYRWLAAFFRQREPRETVCVIVGDHQPMSAVTGDSASWDAPMHTVSRDPVLIERLVALGSHPGMEPPWPAVSALHALTGLLLCPFARPPLETGACPAAKLAKHSGR